VEHSANDAVTTIGRWPVLAPPARIAASQCTRPDFSVVIAARDAAATLGTAIESVLGQTTPAAEIVVCDDGSTDDTASVAARYDEVRLIRQPPSGVAAAKNAAAGAATGEFVVILDADDVFEPERLEALSAVAEARPDLDLLTTDAYVEAGGCVLGTWSVLFQHFASSDQAGEIVRRCFPFPHVAVRRATLFAHGGFDESLASAVDWDCWIRLILGGSAMGCVAAPLARYKVTPGSVTSSAGRQALGHVRMFEKLLRDDGLAAARAPLEAALRHWRREASIVGAEELLLGGDLRGFRRAANAIARDNLFERSTRLKAATAAAVPRLAQARLRRRYAQAGFNRLGRPLESR
jgi:hypothetical protein